MTPTLERAYEPDFDRIMEVWESSVRATHHFLSEADINYYRPKIRQQYLAQVQLWAARDGDGRLRAFLGLAPPENNSPARVEMLFVEAEARGRGLGRALINLAANLYGQLELEVNEQNPEALAFYEKMGFRRIGRQELDGEGRPFPLWQMKKEAE